MGDSSAETYHNGSDQHGSDNWLSPSSSEEMATKKQRVQASSIPHAGHQPTLTQQWLLHRGDSQMVISDNLGVPADMVESMTYHDKEWSLTNLHKPTTSTHKKQCQAAKRQVMRALLHKNNK